MKIEISKGNESIDAEQVLKKKATKFNNVGHIIVPMGFVDRDLIIVLPKIPMTKVRTAIAKQKKDKTWAIGELKP